MSLKTPREPIRVFYGLKESEIQTVRYELVAQSQDAELPSLDIYVLMCFRPVPQRRDWPSVFGAKRLTLSSSGKPKPQRQKRRAETTDHCLWNFQNMTMPRELYDY